jgi:hypothetical protein
MKASGIDFNIRRQDPWHANANWLRADEPDPISARRQLGTVLPGQGPSRPAATSPFGDVYGEAAERTVGRSNSVELPGSGER